MVSSRAVSGMVLAAAALLFASLATTEAVSEDPRTAAVPAVAAPIVVVTLGPAVGPAEVVPPTQGPPRQSTAPAATTAPPQPATEPTPPRGTGPSTGRGARLLASLHFDWRSLGYRVIFAGPRNGYLGITYPQQTTITIYVRRGQSDRQLLRTLGHELGHAEDLTRMTDADRATYLRLRGLPGSTPWWSCDSCTDYSTGSGDFAEVFATWLVGPGAFRSTLAPRPTTAALRAISALY